MLSQMKQDWLRFLMLDGTLLPFDGFGSPFGRRRGGGGGSPASFSRGYNPTYNAGTTGDLFVSPSGDDTTGTGTVANPYLTITKAVTEAISGDVIKVRAGTYRETVTMVADLSIERYSTEQPKITGANVLTGLVTCEAGDETYLGANWASVYKTGLIALSSLPQSDPRTAFIHEVGEALQLAVARPENPEHPIHLDAPTDWHTASTVNLSGGFIQSFVLAEVTDAYTTAQIEASSIAFQGDPNLGYFDEVAAVTAGAIVLTTTGTYLPSANTAIKDNFMLINLLPAMEQGGWGYRIVGSDVIFYVWPNDTGNIASGIEYTVRSQAVLMTSDTALVGFDVAQCCGYDATNPGIGGTAVTEDTATKHSNITVRQCNIRSHMRVGARGYAPVYFRNVDDVTVDSTTIADVYGMFGTFIQGGATLNMGAGQSPQSVDFAMRPLLRRIRYENVGHSPMRIFASRDGAAIHNQCGETGFAAHANKANCYQYCHNWLWFGNDFTGADGYLTFQNSSAIHWIANYAVVSFEGTDGRAMIDQNGFTDQTPAEAFTLDGTCYVLNNTFAPYSEALVGATFPSVSLGRLTLHPEVDFDLRNNIWHGVDIDDPSLEVARSNNYDTTNVSDTPVTAAATYEDAATGDLTFTAGAAMRGITGSSIAAALTAITTPMTQITASDLLLDVNGAALSHTSPPIGPAVGLDVVTQEVAALLPTISGSVSEGQTLTAVDAVIYKQPRPVVTTNWQIETAGVWADISGATGSTLLLATGDVGKRIRRRNSTPTDDYYSDSTIAVAPAVTLVVPVVLRYSQFTGSASQRETATFTTSNKPILVIVHAGRGAISNATVTVGTSGRAYGTGTSVPLVHKFYRQSNTGHHFLLAPGSGTVTVQVQFDVAQNGCIIEVLELDGATGTGVTISSGVTGTSLSRTITTGTSNSVIIYSASSNTSADEGPTITGATTTNSSGTGVTFNIGAGSAYEQAGTPGLFEATFTWSASVSITAIATEILS